MKYWEVSAYSDTTKKEEYLFNVCEVHKHTDFEQDFIDGTFKEYRGFIVTTTNKTKHECRYCQGDFK